MLISQNLQTTLKIGFTLLFSLLIVVPGKWTVRETSLSSPAIIQPGQQAMRAVWVTPWSITRPEDVDRVLQRVVAGGFNTIFVCIFYEGQTLYPSALANSHEIVETGFDPLAYIMNHVHRQNIEVHAWFIAGKASDGIESPLLTEHPDWGLIGPDGGPIAWLNFTRPEVRQFISDLAIEVVARYGVDGVHLDYIRYPNPEWGFDAYSMDAFQDEYGLDANKLRYEELPAYGVFTGNPLISPSTAQVLATFANGYPAVTLNRYGEGEVVLFNWQANQRKVAVNSEILQRAIQRLLQPGGSVYLLRSETNAKTYGYSGLNQVQVWLEFLGWETQAVGEAEVGGLNPDSVLVMPNIYLISTGTAAQLANFVQQGGGVIFIDGPTPSMHLPQIQVITGMRMRGFYFEEAMIMTATGEHELIPTNQDEACMDSFVAWDALWKEFRRKGVTLTVQHVHQRLKSTFPQVTVSAVVPTNPEAARQVFMQDWPEWLQTGSIDLLIPLTYVERASELGTMLKAWEPAINGDVRIAFGLISYTGGDSTRSPKTAAQLMTEIERVRQTGVFDFAIFELDSISDDQLSALEQDAQMTKPPSSSFRVYLPMVFDP